MVFYLTDVAKTWFLNHEEEIPDWDAFTTKLKDIFGTPTSRKENAKKKLETRRQGEETYTSYIEDVLALCRRVNCEMQESRPAYYMDKADEDWVPSLKLGYKKAVKHCRKRSERSARRCERAGELEVAQALLSMSALCDTEPPPSDTTGPDGGEMLLFDALAAADNAGSPVYNTMDEI
ncbi:hypothetical protein HPB47_023146 [Ixodes persulcatus]|uniref:Uncharacterized protein n=1 Tax=Ixodes persulcatus TaxID=34615 RepID=A0AC60Q8W6_IXOPE|nr:hypothetical protein HPB47_023146 [Ixodes persulcatus]